MENQEKKEKNTKRTICTRISKASQQELIERGVSTAWYLDQVSRYFEMVKEIKHLREANSALEKRNRDIANEYYTQNKLIRAYTEKKE